MDNTLSEGHTSLAFSPNLFDWNWKAAEKEFRRAIEPNPGYATAYHWYAWHLSVMGQNSEAIAEIRKAESVDPPSLIINADLAELLLSARFSDESIQQSRKALDFAVAYIATTLYAHSRIFKFILAYAVPGPRNEALKTIERSNQAIQRFQRCQDCLDLGRSGRE